MSRNWRITIVLPLLCFLLPAHAQQADTRERGTTPSYMRGLAIEDDATPFDIVLQSGHEFGKNIAFSHDKRFAATAGRDAKLILWDRKTARAIRTFVGHQAPLSAVAFSRDDKVLVTGSGEALVHRDDSVRGWDVATGKQLWKIETGDTVYQIAFSPDGRLLVFCGEDGLTLVEFATLKVLRSFRHATGLTWALKFSPNGRFVAVADSNNKAALLWDVENGTHRSFGNQPARAIAFSSDSKRLAVADFGRVKIFDVSSGRQTDSHVGFGYVKDLAFKGEQLLLLDNSAKEDEIRLWDVVQKSKIWSKSGRWGEQASLFAEEERIAVKSDVYNFSSGLRVGQFEQMSVPADGVIALASGNLISASFWPVLWDGRSGKLLHKFDERPTRSVAFAVTTDQQRLISAGRDKSLSIWEIDSRQLIRTITLDNAPESVHVVEDGRAVYLENDSNVVRLDLDSGRVIETIPYRRKHPTISALAAAGQFVAFSDSNELFLWDTRGKRFVPLAGWVGHVKSIAFTRDGGRLIVVHESYYYHRDAHAPAAIKIWDTSTGELLKEITNDVDYTSKLAVSPDGTLFAAAGDDTTVRLRSFKTGDLRAIFRGNAGPISSVTFSADGRRLITGGDSIQTWDLEKGDLLSTSSFFYDLSWLTITPEGFFDASESPNGAKLLNVVRGFVVQSIDQLYDSLHRPDLLHGKLSGDPEGKVKSAAASLSLSKAVASGAAPVAKIDRAHRAGIAETQALVKATVTDRGGGLGKIEWRVNGATLGVDRPTQSPSGGSWVFEREFSLADGANRIQIVAYNTQGLAASESNAIDVHWTRPVKSKAPKLYVLAIGINDYWDSRLRLTFAVPDAMAVSHAFKGAGERLYEQVEVKMLLDKDVTAGSLDAIFADYSKRILAEDVFVLFMAGHGKTEEGRFYFIPYDFRYSNSESVIKSGVSQERIQKWLASIQARKSLLMFDACESGSLIGDRVAFRGFEEKTAIDKLARAVGRTVLTATTDDKPAAEGYRGHGVFTYAILSGIGSADANADGIVDVIELASFIDRKVPEISQEAWRIVQVPQMRIVGSNFPLISKAPMLANNDAKVVLPIVHTHVVISSVILRAEASGGSQTAATLDPGLQVSLTQTQDLEWYAVGRSGRMLGYLSADLVSTGLVRLQ